MRNIWPGHQPKMMNDTQTRTRSMIELDVKSSESSFYFYTYKEIFQVINVWILRT